ncbi:hypothetical protein [Lentzea albida]|uniref:Uncharacterized protein n=1 Tax=Lentzea albida TaxID=65499 RepID=A0A1H9GFM4_9PSEU|nr:hypothetical protein [Lentzea albida]SEQ48857.1 hypothetical protein SAMN04488000_103105 [Lentzea albida]
MKVRWWAVLGIGSLAALTAYVHAPVQELRGLEDLCAQPGARCGSQPGWYTGQESYETLRGVEMSARLPGVEVVYDHRLFWALVVVTLVWTAVAALREHRHRFRRGDQANG